MVATVGSADCILNLPRTWISRFNFMILPDDKTRLQELIKRTQHLWKFLECDEKKKKISDLEVEMSAPAFWDDQANAGKVGSESNRLKQTVSRIEDFRSEVEDLEALCELCEEDEDDQDEEDDDLEDDEDGMDEESEEEDPSESRSALALDKNRRKGAGERRKDMIANRALRIKMGKSGAQAASRRSIKKGKDACQRKLWNQDVSKMYFSLNFS